MSDYHKYHKQFRSAKEIEQDDAVLSWSETVPAEEALTWFKNSYISMAESVANLKDTINQLRQLANKKIKGGISLKEAKLMGVCRLCRESSIILDSPFVLNFGKEYAHQKCVDQLEVMNKRKAK